MTWKIFLFHKTIVRSVNWKLVKFRIVIYSNKVSSLRLYVFLVLREKKLERLSHFVQKKPHYFLTLDEEDLLAKVSKQFWKLLQFT